MTAFDRSSQLDRRIAAALDDIAMPRTPDYLDDILRQTARTSQRPRWTFLERWIPVDTTAPRPAGFVRLPARPLIVLLVLAALLAAATVAYVGSRHPAAPPFGPAANGRIGYISGGDLYTRDTVAGAARLLVGGDGDQAFPFFSPDGTKLGFSTTKSGSEYLMVANADGSNARQLLDKPLDGAAASWSPDSTTMAVTTIVNGFHRLILVPVDGSPPRQLDLGNVEAFDAFWRPPDGKRLLFHGVLFGTADLYTINPDGTDLQQLNIAPRLLLGNSNYDASGAAWSPNGASIAYNGLPTDPNTKDWKFRVHRIAPDGSADVELSKVADPTVMEAWPAYSPDGAWILVHRWTWKSNNGGQGWLAAMPADGSAPARDIGPKIAGGEDTGLTKAWSPDGTYVLMRADNTQQVFKIDPVTGSFESLPFTSDLPDVQRLAP
jgi:Tol biopolymer transport system component